MDLAKMIRTVLDFPKKGIGFKDITTLLKDPLALKESVQKLCEPFMEQNIDLVVGIESRGFIFGGAMALQMGVGFVPIRKAGKLPADTVSESYALEYGTDTIEIHRDAIQKGLNILLVDDLLATGGTAAAAIRLIEKLEGNVIAVCFLIELSFLNGRQKLGDCPVHVLINSQEE